MKKPNLFVVGEQKTGTSTIHNYLNDHPDIYMSDPKEHVYFATDVIREGNQRKIDLWPPKYSKNYASYKSIFKYSDKYLYEGESGTHYSHSTEAAANIYKFNPTAKIIMGFREPVSFLKSLHRQYLKEAIEDQVNFKDALMIEEKRKAGKSIPPSAQVPSFLFYSNRIEYDKHLNKFLEKFPRNQIFVYIFEDFKKDNQKVMSDIFKFLELEQIEVRKKIVNKKSEVRNYRLRKILIRSYKIRRIAQIILPYKIRKWWGKFVNKYTLSDIHDSKHIDEGLRSQLKEKYRLNVINLNKLLHKHRLYNKDLLSMWGYDKS